MFTLAMEIVSVVETLCNFQDICESCRGVDSRHVEVEHLELCFVTEVASTVHLVQIPTVDEIRAQAAKMTKMRAEVTKFSRN